MVLVVLPKLGERSELTDNPELQKFLARGFESIHEEMKHREKVRQAKREAELRRIKGEDSSDENPRF